MDDQFIVVRGIGYGLYKTRILRADILLRDLFQCLKPTFSKKMHLRWRLQSKPFYGWNSYR